MIAMASISASQYYTYNQVTYGAPKAALLLFVKSLAWQVTPKGINAKVVSPGTIQFNEEIGHRVETDVSCRGRSQCNGTNGNYGGNHGCSWVTD